MALTLFAGFIFFSILPPPPPSNYHSTLLSLFVFFLSVKRLQPGHATTGEGWGWSQIKSEGVLQYIFQNSEMKELSRGSGLVLIVSAVRDAVH